MKAALVFLSAVALVAAEPPSSYGVPTRGSGGGGSSGSFGGFSSGSSGSLGGGSSGSSGFGGSGASRFGGSSGGGDDGGNYQSQTFKNVFVYSAPDEAPETQTRTIRVPGGDKHVNIVFVKTPSSSSSQQTEVILPEQDEHKNLVYVLLKKNEASSDVKIRRPAPRQQTKPEVNFIRYQDSAAAAAGPAPSNDFGGGAPIPVRTPSSTYGADF